MKGVGVVRGWEWDKDRADDEIPGDTFTTYSAAQTRSCNNQHNACADIANNKSVRSSRPISLNIEC